MEPITHFLTGACLGRAGLNRKTGLATLTLVLASEMPDIDVVWYLGGSVAGLQHHRGFTHTLLGAPLMAALSLAVVYGIYRLLMRRGRRLKLPPNWKLLYVYALLASLVHIFLDFTNNYGVRPFAPFSWRWYSWDIVFIIDPIILAALFMGLVIPGLLGLITEEIGARKSGPRGRGGAIFALAIYVALICVRDYEHRRAVNLLEALTYNNEEPVRVSAFPSEINPFMWNGVVETRDFFETTVVDPREGVIDPHGRAMIRYKPEETPVTLAAKKSWLGRVYLDWALYPVVEAERLPDQGYKVQFVDLRFAYITSEQRRIPLAGYVIVDSSLRVMDQYVGAEKQVVRSKQATSN